MRSAEDLLQELISLDESHRIEAKRCTQVDKSVMETVCAYSNEPGLGGGYLLLGVVRDEQDFLKTPTPFRASATPTKSNPTSLASAPAFSTDPFALVFQSRS